MRTKTQDDIVKLKTAEDSRGPATEKFNLPGIETLHLKPKDEIAEVLTNVLKSRSNIAGLKWIAGQPIEIYLKTE